jgi:hypothetical protein
MVNTNRKLEGFGIEYNILKDGDRHLRGKLAEEVFVRVKERLLPKDILYCKTAELYNFLRYHKSTIDKIIAEYAAGKYSPLLRCMEIDNELDDLRKKLGIRKKRDIEDVLDVKPLCLLCLGYGQEWVHMISSDHLDLYLCWDCLDSCKKYGCKVSYTQYLPFGVVLRWPPKFEGFNTILRSFLYEIEMLKFEHVLKVLSRLSEGQRKLIYEVYGEVESGPHPFDFVAVDEEGTGYLIDVTSVRGFGQHAPLSEREEKIARLAKRLGFKILIPVVKFLKDWKVRIELIEQTDEVINQAQA